MGELFWMLVLLSLMQPVLRRFNQDLTRRRLIQRIERERGSRVILLVHRQETSGFFGFPVVRHIGIDDSEEIIHAIRMTDPMVPLDIVLHTPGGLVLPSVQIARAIKSHPGPVTAFVPHYAMSGGTLIALAADRIVMSEHAVLGPVDPHLGTVPAASVRSVLARKPVSEIEDQTLILADQAEKAIAQLTSTVNELLAGVVEPAQARQVAHLLCEGTWTHDFPLTQGEARRLGLPVSTDIPPEVVELIRLHPGAGTQETVEYLPARHAAPPAPGAVPSATSWRM